MTIFLFSQAVIDKPDRSYMVTVVSHITTREKRSPLRLNSVSWVGNPVNLIRLEVLRLIRKDDGENEKIASYLYAPYFFK